MDSETRAFLATSRSLIGIRTRALSALALPSQKVRARRLAVVLASVPADEAARWVRTLADEYLAASSSVPSETEEAWRVGATANE